MPRYARTLNEGELFRPAYDGQVSKNGLKMFSDITYRAVKKFPQSPYYVVAKHASSSFVIHPYTPILSPDEAVPTKYELLAFICKQATYTKILSMSVIPTKVEDLPPPSQRLFTIHMLPLLLLAIGRKSYSRQEIRQAYKNLCRKFGRKFGDIALINALVKMEDRDMLKMERTVKPSQRITGPDLWTEVFEGDFLELILRSR